MCEMVGVFWSLLVVVGGVVGRVAGWDGLRAEPHHGSQKHSSRLNNRT